MKQNWIVADTGCWLWQGALTHNGYGRVKQNYRDWRAHVLMFVETYGDVPSGCIVSHLCHTRSCVNPAHLVAESQGANLGRSSTDGRLSREFCRAGLHRLIGVNIKRTRGGAGRRCRECDNAYQRRAYAKRVSSDSHSSV